MTDWGKITGILGINCARVLCLVVFLLSPARAGEDQVYQINLPAQPVAKALNSLSEQTGAPVFFSYDLVKSRKANSVAGRYSLLEVLALMLEGTGLTGGLSDKGMIVISPADSNIANNDNNNEGRNMSRIGQRERTSRKSLLDGVATFFASLLVVSNVTGQEAATGSGGLEEIVVTAQRREQNLQEVPISIQVISGTQIELQGFRSMTDVERFTPSLQVEESMHRHSITMRGIGGAGANLALENSVPLFVDGVHFGRSSMIKGALLDVERVEILKGPQPIYFGQNASAGAISVISRKPGQEWEGFINAEAGNFGSKNVKGAYGGPLTDTFGIRVAAQWDEITGWLTDIVDGHKFPQQENKVGRLTLQWTPTDNFTAILKGEVADRNSTGDSMGVCGTEGDLRGSGNQPSLVAVLFPGEVPAWDATHTNRYLAPDCVDGFTKLGLGARSEYAAPVAGIRDRQTRSGILNVVDLATELAADTGIVDPAHPLLGQEPIDNTNMYLGLNYEFANGVELNLTTGMVDYQRSTMRDPLPTPFLGEAGSRTEELDMWSQEVVFRSPADSDSKFEWAFGAYYQQEDLDLTPSQVISANLRTPVLRNEGWQDAKWKSAFATLTYNFFDDKASIDIGGRYTDVHKDGQIVQYGRHWIFNINPDPDNDGLIPDASGLVTQRFNTDPAVTSQNRVIINCATGNRAQCGSYGAGFWSATWNVRDTPALWNTQAPVDYSPWILSPAGVGPYADTFDDNSFDPQIVLRYRPSEDTSFYAKWARAFKGGGFDTSEKSLPTTLDNYSFDSEHAENFEIGAKGTLMDGRVRYEADIFQQTMKDLQVETSLVLTDPNTGLLVLGGSVASNAGEQRTRGMDVDISWSATDQLTLGLSGALMDGEYTKFEFAGCSDYEVEHADTGDCLSTQESIDLYGSAAFAGTIDRTGQKAPRTPDWKFVLNVDYWIPVFEQYKATFNTIAGFTAGHVTDALSFDEVIKYDDYIDWNLSAGFGDRNDIWQVTFWGRNLLGARLKYFPEYDVDPVGFQNDYGLGVRSYTTYGVQMQYNFR